MKQPPLQPQDVHRFVEEIAGHALHAKQVESLAHAIVGAMHADTASIAAIGRAAARQRDVTEKHSIKQVDRLLSNGKLNVSEVQRCIVAALVVHRPEVVVALDWTEFAPDGHSTLAISMIADHGRATPLVWRSIPTKKLNGRRSKLEQRLRQLRSMVPLATKVTILADRGFGNTALFQLIEGLGFSTSCASATAFGWSRLMVPALPLRRACRETVALASSTTRGLPGAVSVFRASSSSRAPACKSPGALRPIALMTPTQS